MTVKELMEMLRKFNPDAKVCVEAWSDPAANEAREYMVKGVPHVYIGDDLDSFEEEFGFKPTNTPTDDDVLTHLNNLAHELDGAMTNDPEAVPMIEKAIEDALKKADVETKGFLDIKSGDLVIVQDEYSHDYLEHRIRIGTVCFDKEYITESNPHGMVCHGTDLDEEDWGDDYITVVTEANFCRIVEERRIVRVDIVDNDVQYEERLLRTYYLENPDEDKLNELKYKIEHRFDYNTAENITAEEIAKAEKFIANIWDEIEKFIEENFTELSVTDDFEISY